MIKCPICGGNNNINVFTLRNIPVTVNTFFSNKNSALNIPKDKINLRYCTVCSHLYNSAFDPRKIIYGDSYENSLFFSSFFRDYAENQIGQLIRRNSLHKNFIIEIGSGKGDYIELLCKKTNSKGIGFDPSVTKDASEDGRVCYIKDNFKKELITQPPHYIICRQTLEHLHNPKQLLQEIREVLSKNQGTIFIEVPNGLYLIKHIKIFDLIYEHVSYYTPSSIKKLLVDSGFKIVQFKEDFGGQYLSVEAKPGKDKTHSLDSIEHRIMAFSEKSPELIQYYLNKISQLNNQEKKIAIWGTGSKGVMFLNLTDKNRNVQYCIDINPNKKGKFIPGTAHKIIQPGFLKVSPSDVIFIMNEIYRQEIQETLKSMNNPAEIYIV